MALIAVRPSWLHETGGKERRFSFAPNRRLRYTEETVIMIVQLRRQLSVAIENQPGRLGQIGRLLAARDIHIDAFSVIDNVEQGMVRLMTSDPGAARDLLKAAGLPVVEAEVLAIEMTDRTGNLAIVGETLAAAVINIEYAYASTAQIGQPARLILKSSSPLEARRVLEAIPS